MADGRSKLERWIEYNLITSFPNIQFEFNNRDYIGMELDIFLPQHNLAIEINGPIHYLPIFGRAKLNQQRKRDRKKCELCKFFGIDLYIVNTTDQKKVTLESCELYVNAVKYIIEKHLI